MGNTSIVIDTSLLQSPLFVNAHHVKAWLFLLMSAEAGEGTYRATLGELASRTGLSVKQVRAALDKLVSLGLIVKTTTNQHTLVTILNYNNYILAIDAKGKQEGKRIVNETSNISTSYKGAISIEGKQEGKRTEIEGKQEGKRIVNENDCNSNSYSGSNSDKGKQEGKRTEIQQEEKEKDIKEKEEYIRKEHSSKEKAKNEAGNATIATTKLEEKNCTKEENCAKEEKPLIPAFKDEDASLFDLDSKEPENSLILGNDVKCDYDSVVRIWNSTAKCVKVIKLTDARRAKIAIRFGEWASVGEPLSVLKSICERISQSDFCRGANKTGWKATLDWLTANDRNWIKAAEGAYDNPEQKKGAADTAVKAGVSKDVNSKWAR